MHHHQTGFLKYPMKVLENLGFLLLDVAGQAAEMECDQLRWRPLYHSSVDGSRNEEHAMGAQPAFC